MFFLFNCEPIWNFIKTLWFPRHEFLNIDFCFFSDSKSLGPLLRLIYAGRSSWKYWRYLGELLLTHWSVSLINNLLSVCSPWSFAKSHCWRNNHRLKIFGPCCSCRWSKISRRPICFAIPTTKKWLKILRLFRQISETCYVWGFSHKSTCYIRVANSFNSHVVHVSICWNLWRSCWPW